MDFLKSFLFVLVVVLVLGGCAVSGWAVLQALHELRYGVASYWMAVAVVGTGLSAGLVCFTSRGEHAVAGASMVLVLLCYMGGVFARLVWFFFQAPAPA